MRKVLFTLLLSLCFHTSTYAGTVTAGLGEVISEFKALITSATSLITACHANGDLSITNIETTGYRGFAWTVRVTPGDTFVTYNKEGLQVLLTFVAVEDCKGRFEY